MRRKPPARACGRRPPGWAGSQARRWARSLGSITTLRDGTQGLPLPGVVAHLIEASGLVEHYKSERDGADRVENLGELVNAAAAFAEDEDFGAQIADDAAAAEQRRPIRSALFSPMPRSSRAKARPPKAPTRSSS